MKGNIQKEVEKTANILKDRPSISITPVTQALPSINPAKPATTPPKTLQEKLADKQKQQQIIDKLSRFTSPPSKPVDKSGFASMSSAKVLDFGSKVEDKPTYQSSSSNTFKNPSLSNISIPSSLNVFPSFSKESGYISQV